MMRLATIEDGEVIGNLCARCKYDVLEGTDWTKAYPYWCVAEVDGLVLGTCQICLGLPVGRIEFLAVEPELGKAEKARVVMGLAEQAQNVLRAAGCTLASFMVPHELESYMRVLEKRGARPLFDGVTLVKRLV